jgi:NADH-quinone oxidoreductase subunit J
VIVLFWITAFVAIASAIWVISSRQPVHSVVGLIVNFVALLTIGAQPVEIGPGRLSFQAVPSVVAGLAALVLMGAGLRVAWSQSAASPPPDLGTVASFGQQLLTTHVFAFEVTAFILLIAIVGVVMMAGRKELRF